MLGEGEGPWIGIKNIAAEEMPGILRQLVIHPGHRPDVEHRAALTEDVVGRLQDERVRGDCGKEKIEEERCDIPQKLFERGASRTQGDVPVAVENREYKLRRQILKVCQS